MDPDTEEPIGMLTILLLQWMVNKLITSLYSNYVLKMYIIQ